MRTINTNTGVSTTYDRGGIVQQDGPAMVHAKEAVLNPTQTKILKENILSSKPNSLISLLQSYNEAYRGLSSNTYDSITNNSSGINIEKAEVNMNVAKIDNDYDAQRAGEQALEKMVSIARKTAAQNRIGR